MFKYCNLRKYLNCLKPDKFLALIISSSSEFYSLILCWMNIVYFYQFKICLLSVQKNFFFYYEENNNGYLWAIP